MYKIRIGGERFGNNIIQLINAISLAEKTNVPVVSYSIPHLNGNEILIQTSTPSEEIVIDSFIYNIKSRFPQYEPLTEEEQRRICSIIKPHLKIVDHEYENDLSNGLFVHIRSGDIFKRADPHPRYIQPPLDFYKKVFNIEKARKLFIFYEDDKNPVVNKLKELYPTAKFVRERMDKLILVFSKASYVVSGTGTLIPSILLFNDNLKINYTTHTWINRKNTTVALFPDYINIWKNTEEQLALMITYDKTIIPSSEKLML
jgi:hypothetical protein